MNILKSGNPTLSEKRFEQSLRGVEVHDTMTQRGALNKFGIMMLLLFASAAFTWKAAGESVNVFPWIIGSMIGGFIVALIITFKQKSASYLAPVYALLEGVFLGGISAYFSSAFAEVAPDLITQAVGLTFGVVIAMYALFHFRVIRATEKFKSVIIIATVGIGVFYLLSWIVGMFGVTMPLIYDNGTMGIVFSLVVVVIAALNLILDFDRIEQGAAMGAPKHMEWYCAFGLLVTIVWLYLEILRLLSKLASRD